MASYHVLVINTIGNIVFQKYNLQGTRVVNVKSLPPGMYFIRLEQNGETEIRKLVIE